MLRMTRELLGTTPVVPSPTKGFRVTITAEERAQLSKNIAGVDEIIAPLRKALKELEDLRKDLIEPYADDIVGNCEGCGRLLFVGDKGHRCHDGPILCAECAPTWNDIGAQWNEMKGSADDDPDLRFKFWEAFAQHAAAGGTGDDKALVTL